MNITTASRQWSIRPSDQRFVSLDELETACDRSKQASKVIDITTDMVRIIPANNDYDLNVQVLDQELTPSHWSFGQLATAARCPAEYMRRLPAPLASINLQWGIEHSDRKENKLMFTDNTIQALTSTSYGRIWDIDVVRAVKRVNSDGRWVVPAASYAKNDPRKATTLYASDHDVFIFLVDDKNPIEVDNETLFRGFIVSNSETGAGAFELNLFLYRYVCDNRIIWGAKSLGAYKTRHSLNAPMRFVDVGQRLLKEYSTINTLEEVEMIKSAKTREIAKNDKDAVAWLRSRGFADYIAKGAVNSAVKEEGSAGNVWSLVQGLTAYARDIEHTDTRFSIEQKAGALLGE